MSRQRLELPDKSAVEFGRLVDRGLRRSRVVDTESSCTGPSNTRQRKQKRLTSTIWNEFERLTARLPDGSAAVTAKCNTCGAVLQVNDSSTSNLWSHHKSHQKRGGATSSAAQVTPFTFNPITHVKALAAYIVQANQPLGLGEDPLYVSYVRRSLQPAYQPVSRAAITREILAMYENQKNSIMAELLETPSNNVAFSSEIWSSDCHYDYLSIVAHYLDVNWVMKRRIIGFEQLDTHTGKEIADKLFAVLDEFHLVGRTIAITFDNAAADLTTSNELKAKFLPTAGEYLIHQRCAAHVINLMVQAGLKEVGPTIRGISGTVRYAFGCNLHLGRWMRYCESKGLPERIIPPDMEIRWNTTYIMLDRLLPYAEHFQAWFNKDYGENILRDEHWVVGRMVHSFFKDFYEATIYLSSLSEPTSPLAMHALHEIALIFEDCHRPELRPIIDAMVVVFRKYFFPMPTLYSLAFILDPRIKTKGLKEFFGLIQSGTGIPYESTYEEVVAQAYYVYHLYDVKYTSPSLDNEVKYTSPSLDNEVFTHSSVKVSWDKYNAHLQQLAATTSSPSSSSHNNDNELTLYLDTKFRNIACGNLDLMDWWRLHESDYPILAVMARDILTIPVTSVSSESAFSSTKYMLDPSRNMVPPKMVKVLTCLKDWEHAQSNEQSSPSQFHRSVLDDFQNWNLNTI